MKNNILLEIIETKKAEVEAYKSKESLESLKMRINMINPPKNVLLPFQQQMVRGKMSLIAEVKKASPSKGIIREAFKPLEIASTYEKACAQAISVLTDEKYFQGKLEYLELISKTVNIPVLRKDFIVDPYQIYQSRAYGADLILLICAVLEESQLLEYITIAKNIGLECLVETHTVEELDFCLKNDVKFVGINNRDLKTFKTDIDHTVTLLENRHACNRIIVSESGITSHGDIVRLSDARVSAVLVGEHFMRQEDVYTAVQEMMSPTSIVS